MIRIDRTHPAPCVKVLCFYAESNGVTQNPDLEQIRSLVQSYLLEQEK